MSESKFQVRSFQRVGGNRTINEWIIYESDWSSSHAMFSWSSYNGQHLIRFSLKFQSICHTKLLHDLKKYTAKDAHEFYLDSLTSFRTVQLCFIRMTCMRQAFSSCDISSLKLWSAMRGQAQIFPLQIWDIRFCPSWIQFSWKINIVLLSDLAQSEVNHTGKRIHAYGFMFYCLKQCSVFLAGTVYIWLPKGLYCAVSTKPAVLTECAGRNNFSMRTKKVWWAFPKPQPFPNIRLYAMLTNTWRVKSQWLSSPFSTREEARVLLFMYRGVPYITLAWHLRLDGWHWHWNIDFNLKWVMDGKPSMSHMVCVYNEVPLCVYVQSEKLTVFQPTQYLSTSVKTQICAW